MAIDFNGIVGQVDSTLLSLGLYKDITFIDTSTSTGNYDPLTGTYPDETSVTYTFKAVVLSEGSNNESGNTYGVTQKLVVIPTQIQFSLEVDQILSIDGINWQIMSYELAPQDTIYTINLRRK